MRTSNTFYEFKMAEIVSFSSRENTNAMRKLTKSVVYKIHTSTRIPGYNYTLLRASEKGMKFGVNGDLIYHKQIVEQMKAHQPGASHLGTSKNYTISPRNQSWSNT